MSKHCFSALASVHLDVLPQTDHIDVIGTEAHINHSKAADVANKFIEQLEQEYPLLLDILGETFSKCSVEMIKCDALTGLWRSREHCLDKCSAWFSSLLLAVDDVEESGHCSSCLTPHGSPAETRIYLAQTSINQQQFDRAAYFCQKLPTSIPLARYLYFYSKLLALEKKYVDNRVKPLSTHRDDMDKLKLLADEMKKEEKTLDSYTLYIYALTLQKLKFNNDARRILQKSIELDPLNWSSWDELSKLIDTSKMLLDIQLPDHWMKAFYVAQVLHRLQILNESLYLYCHILLKLPRFTNVLNAIGIVCHDQQKASEGIESFLLARELDPCSMDCVDYMSNTLFLLNRKEELALLSDWLLSVDKYRPETCIVVSNYCSIRGDHEKAVDYLERALLLDPYWQYAYVLLGHEYMELKNINAATEAYRKAIQLDNADYRSWYGLGQTYEIMKMYHFALHYFKEAHRLKPNDSRFLVAMGDCYDNLHKSAHAVSMYWQAYCCDDTERMALSKLAKTYEKDHNNERAARAYAYMIYDYGNKGWDEVELGDAYLYLARYHLGSGEYDAAITCAHKCMQYVEVKERAKAILQQITDIRKWQKSENEVQAFAGAGVGEGSMDVDREAHAQALQASKDEDEVLREAAASATSSHLVLPPPSMAIGITTPILGGLNAGKARPTINFNAGAPMTTSTPEPLSVSGSAAASGMGAAADIEHIDYSESPASPAPAPTAPLPANTPVFDEFGDINTSQGFQPH